jgi:hypothetical protein
MTRHVVKYKETRGWFVMESQSLVCPMSTITKLRGKDSIHASILQARFIGLGPTVSATYDVTLNKYI